MNYLTLDEVKKRNWISLSNLIISAKMKVCIIFIRWYIIRGYKTQRFYTFYYCKYGKNGV